MSKLKYLGLIIDSKMRLSELVRRTTRKAGMGVQQSNTHIISNTLLFHIGPNATQIDLRLRENLLVTELYED